MLRLFSFLCALCAAPPLYAEIVGMQVPRAVTEREMIASLRKIELVDEAGAPFDLRAVISNGKPTLITLWANWCPNCRAEIPGYKAIAEKCPTRWNIVFVSARRSDYAQDVAKFKSYGLPWKFYNVSKASASDPARARIARAFYGETTEGGVVTPQHYVLSHKGDVDMIAAGRMDFSDPTRLATFCAQ
ncbi:MAG: TlpA family protein disulfide reductase [Methylocystis sp.]|nr:TlpA family protein disulfide reductase [Methylocystis sp.]